MQEAPTHERGYTELTLTIPERTAPGPDRVERIHIQLSRCGLESCQQLLAPGLKYCGEPHRNAAKNQRTKDRS